MRKRDENRFSNSFIPGVGRSVTPGEDVRRRRSKEDDPRQGLVNNLIDDRR